MHVPNIERDAGSPTSAPRAAVRSATNAALIHSVAPTISLTRLAWFDANGDGRIDTRPAGAGGDATLLVPTHEVELPTYGRAALPRLDGRTTKPNEPASAAAPTRPNPVRTQQAAASYQRDGQAPPPLPAPVASVASAALPTAVADATSAASPARAVA